jgi:aspartate aminotransferase
MFVPMGQTLIQRAVEAGVIIVPGAAFGTRAPDHARFSYATAQENLSRAVGRIGTLME